MTRAETALAALKHAAIEYARSPLDEMPAVMQRRVSLVLKCCHHVAMAEPKPRKKK